MADNKLAGLSEAENRADTLDGGQGSDSVNGGQAADTLDGARGADTLSGGRGSDTVYGGQGSESSSLGGAQGADTVHGGQAGDATDEDRRQAESDNRKGDAFEADPTSPTVGLDGPDAADTVAARKPETDAPARFEPVQAPTPTFGSDAYGDLGGPHVLNASPGADPLVAPNVETQRTGPNADTVYRAPGMTRGSAINNVEVRYGELIALLHDFDHDTTGLSPDVVALIDFVKTRSGTRA